MKQEILTKVIFDVETKKSIPIDLNKIIKGRALFQANSGGGKSYIVRKFLEESHGIVQQIIIDPEGEYHTLRELPDNDYLLVSKDKNADIQLDIKHAPLLAKKLMETGANAIIDIYEMNPFDRIRFVKVFLDALVNLPKNLWHQCLIVIDEIHTFAPESSKAESLESVASLASRGRKRGYALIGATQKLSKFHKDVAAELNTKFTGRCTLDIDQKRAAAELGIKAYQTLRDLDFEFYVYGPAIPGGTIKVKSYPVKTTHEDIGTTADFKIANPEKIKKLRENFQELPQEAENELKTVEDLRSKIRELTTSLNSVKASKPIQDPYIIENTKREAYSQGLRVGIESTTLHFKSNCQDSRNAVFSAETMLRNARDRLDEVLLKEQNIALPNPIKPSPPIKILNVRINNPMEKTIGFSTEEKIGRCEESILKALIQRGKKSSKLQVAVIAGYSHTSGGFNNAISRLKSLGFMLADNGELEITNDGINYIGYSNPIPDDHETLLNFWVGKIGKCPGEILKYICKNQHSWNVKSHIANATGYSENSGGFNNGLSKVVSLGLAERGHGGMFRASQELFPHG